MTNIWKYTDDVVVFLVMATWVYGKVTGACIVEDTWLGAVLGYVFGNLVGQKAKQK